MTEAQERLARSLAERQLTMNAHTIETLEREGLRSDHVVQLDFMFIAPDQACAGALASYLAANDCEAIEVKASGDSTEHYVHGKSHPTRLTRAIVDDWVQWMVV